MVFGAQNYSMRLILDPDQDGAAQPHADRYCRCRPRTEPRFSCREQSAGSRHCKGTELTIPVITQGRLTEVKEFEEMIVRALPNGSMIRLKDVARVELGAQSYNLEGRWNGKPMTFLLTFLSPGANALDTVKRVRNEMDELSKSFPAGVSYDIPYDTTRFIEVSIQEVVKTLAEAMVLVILVVYLFLQSWRATLIPGVAVPVSLIGTFAGMQALGFSINTLTSSGWCWPSAWWSTTPSSWWKMSNATWQRRAVAEGGGQAGDGRGDWAGHRHRAGAVRGVRAGRVSWAASPGELYKQFAITIAISVIISGIVALTLSPALCRARA